jgi:hypothetical protein
VSVKAQFPDESVEGAFVRQGDAFRDWVRADGSTAYPPEFGRYHLYVSLACPWAHRTIIVRKLKGLEDAVGMSVVDPVREEWKSPGGDAEGTYVFDARSGTWDELWVTSDTSRNGGLLRAPVARLDDGGLRFAGEDRTTDGKPYRHEVYLRPDGSGKLLQLMRVSVDGGLTWQERFRATWSRTP